MKIVKQLHYMNKNKYFKDFTELEILRGYNSMVREIDILPDGHSLIEVFNKAWISFCNNEWSYDGATFVNERFKNTKFEVAGFIHDWRNSMGYVGYYIDYEMFVIMILLNYELSDILKRYLLTRLTFINIIRHKYFTKNYLKEKPNNLIKMKKDFSWNLEKDYDGI